MMIEIDEGLTINPRAVAAVKRTGDDTCAVFMKGQSAVDGGFLVKRSYDDVVEEIDEGLEETHHAQDEE